MFSYVKLYFAALKEKWTRIPEEALVELEKSAKRKG